MKEQIEKMACDMCVVKHICNEPNKPIATCYALKCAKRAYESGYRKQSEGLWRVSGDIFKTYFCSECGYSVDHSHQKTRFCPECGAHMKGGAE